MPTATITANASERVNNNNWMSGSSWIWFGNHFAGAGGGHVTGWILEIDEDDVPSTISDLDEATIEFEVVNANTADKFGDFTIVEDVSSFSQTSSPYDIWDTANGTVAWDPAGAGWTAGSRQTSPNLVSLLEAALNASSGPVGGVYQLALLHRGDSGGSAGQTQIKSLAYSGDEPVFTFSVPADPNATGSADRTPAATWSADLVAYEFFDEVSASDHSTTTWSSFGNRIRYDLFLPMGAKPAEGWPLISWTHGGSWNVGNQDRLDRGVVARAVAEGYAVASHDYVKTNDTAFTTDSWWSSPAPVLQLKAQWMDLEENPDIDMDRVVLSGYSAGGHSVLFAAISDALGDSNEYTGDQSAIDSGAGRREPNHNATPTNEQGGDYNFDFDEAGNLSLGFTPLGVYVWMSPIDMDILVDDTSNSGANGWEPGQKDVSLFGLRAYIGHTINNSISTFPELSLTDYLSESGTFTASKSGTIPFPIVYYEGTDGAAHSPAHDMLVPRTAGVDALYDGLDAWGYDVSGAASATTADGTLTDTDFELSGFTWLQGPEEHDDLQNGPDEDGWWNDFYAFIEAVDQGTAELVAEMAGSSASCFDATVVPQLRTLGPELAGPSSQVFVADAVAQSRVLSPDLIPPAGVYGSVYYGQMPPSRVWAPVLEIIEDRLYPELVPSAAQALDVTVVPQLVAVAPELVPSVSQVFVSQTVRQLEAEAAPRSGGTVFDPTVSPSGLLGLYPETAGSSAVGFDATVVAGLRTMDVGDMVSSATAAFPGNVQPLSEDTKYPEMAPAGSSTFGATVVPLPVELYPQDPTLWVSTRLVFDARAVSKDDLTAEFVPSVAHADFWAEVVETGLNRIRYPELAASLAAVFEATVVAGPPNDVQGLGWLAARATALDVSAGNSKLARKVRANVRRWGRTSLKDRVEAEQLAVREDG